MPRRSFYVYNTMSKLQRMNVLHKFWPVTLTACLLLWPGAGGTAGAQPQGILNQPAPEWNVNQWINIEPDSPHPEIADYRGQVLYLYFFQAWCPGCHRHGFPTLTKMLATYDDDPSVAFVAIQSVFEGFSSNTFEHAQNVASKYELNIPVGHSGNNGVKSPLLRSYRSGGTPWTIIVDPEGTVRYNDFHINVSTATALIEQYKQPKPALPESRSGKHLLGTPLDLTGLEWPTGTDVPSPGRATLLRFWTHTCPYCVASLPAIESLRQEYGERGLSTIAVYHAKPRRDFAADDALERARDLSYSGPVAVDPNWNLLRQSYLDIETGGFTSISILLDRDGLVRYVHPGPELRPAAMGGSKEVAADFDDLRLAIEILLAEE